MTIPYVTGTVSVTAGSAVVTGSGTAWATALIAGGLFGLDSSNGNPVPILSIDSNTQLTLAKPWRGTTAAGQGYWIVRDTAYLQQQTVNAQALSTYIQRLDNAALTALAGLAPASDKLAYFTGAGAAALTDLRSKGRDIIAAADLTAARAAINLPLIALNVPDFDLIIETGWYRGGGATPGNPSGQFGMLEHIQYDANHAMQVFYRGSTSEMWFRRKVAGAWLAWVKTNGEMVGSVSQSGGVPTGAIIERGSNANGEYVRFADGTQMCFSAPALLSSGPVTTVSGSVFYGDIVSWTFPVAFSPTSTPVIIGGATRATQRWIGCRTVSSGTGTFTVFSSLSSTTATAIDVAVMGRWF